jgi:ribosomal protein S18 acetylase RimI-like enzyme
VADSAGLLGAYDAQVRTHLPDPLPRGMRAEHDGPLVRVFGLADRGFVLYRDLDGLEGADLDELISRQVRVFADRGERFEWKLHGHDRPPDLRERLRAAGFVPEPEETVLIAAAAEIARAPELPDGVSLREVTDRSDLDRIETLGEAAFGARHAGVAGMLEAEVEADPEAIAIVVAEAGDEMVCAGWVRFEQGTEFATLWGGGTLPAWRRRGIYRALVAYRARLAARRGFRFLQVDALPASRPILERLGFTAVTTTTPYVWAPRAG